MISVLMPTCNHERFIGPALDSVLSQSVDSMQVVVVDDCSQDRTPEVVRQYASRYPQIIFHRNGKNLGVTPTFNIALSLCQGEYVAIFSGDDIMNSGKLQRQLRVMEEEANCILCYHDLEVFDSDSNATLHLFNSGPGREKPVAGDVSTVCREVVLRGIFMGAASLMLRRKVIPPWGFDARIPISSDYLMLIDVLASNRGTVRFIPEALGRYRRHSGNITSRHDYRVEEMLLTLTIARCRYPQYTKESRLHELAFLTNSAAQEIARGNMSRARSILAAVPVGTPLTLTLRRLFLLLGTWKITAPFFKSVKRIKAWIL